MYIIAFVQVDFYNSNVYIFLYVFFASGKDVLVHLLCIGIDCTVSTIWSV